MDFDIVVLGPVELRVGGRREMHGAGKEVLMLAALALDAGRTVSLDTLSERLWDDSPPGKPRASLHAYATRIRRRLGDDRLLRQAAHAYVLDVPAHTVDFHRFERLVVQARSLASSGDDAQALGLLRKAEALWRGAPLTGCTGLWAEQVRRWLAEHRLAETLLRTDIELRMGHFTELMGELSGLLDQYPADETVVQRFMTAAYAGGRQSDALRAYEGLRRRLRELGTEPGETLIRTYHRILDQAPAAELLTDGAPSSAAMPPPQNLPAHSRLLVGRTEQLGALRAAGAGVIAFHAISGMAGVGKSLLALHAARALAHQYPDGQVHISLRAHSGQHPLSPEAALTALLRDFGIPAKALPHDLAGLVTLWRTVLGHRRAVVVLDDAADAAQIQPLLPGDSPSLVLITSRRRLTGIPGLRHIFVDVLSAEDAETLFTTLAGLAPDTDRAEVAEVARLCGYLPLALALAAGRLRSRPAWSAGHLVGRLSPAPGRLAEIRDGRSEIATVFAFSYDTLAPEEQWVFRLLSLHSTSAFDAYTSAALVGLPLQDTERVLESLLDANLLQEPVADRYAFHDLIAAYSHSLVLRDPRTVREQALDRLASFYVHAAGAADRVLQPRRRRLAPAPPPPSLTLPEWSGAQQAKEWLLAETAAVAAAESHLRTRGDAAGAARLADTVSGGFLDAEELRAQAEVMHTHAVRHWHSVGDHLSQAQALLALVAVQNQTGQYDRAERNSRDALAAARAVPDDDVEAEALRALGLVCWYLGRLEEFHTLAEQGLAIVLRSGDEWNIARYRNNVGIALLQLGRHAEAMEFFAAALDGFVRTQDRRGEAQALNNLGDLHLHMGQLRDAHTAFGRVLELVTESGSRAEKAIAQLNLADALAASGDGERALSLHRQALAAFRHIGDRRSETVALNAIGTTLHETGRYAESAAHHGVALALAREIGAAHDEVQALRGLGLAELRSGHEDAAARQLDEALAIGRRIGSSEEEARAHAALAEWSAATGRGDETVRHLRAALAKFSGLNEVESARIRDRIRKLTGDGAA